ncbi:beta-1,3-glucan-binding protein-like [Dreissena polymorpha]|uniref:Uncharacterized protein n=1 Tax=Dreissena polymorpha TaxID=45954 RepID=A0A9D4MVT4_DREPO|nr:beta-1,3-glucan-binding protein-like [Dreissena polymorpha]XP_052213477.1 beta-1,3-glucan-binding protein-like [Dreissena polymorpha]XP_052213486.1 beta-1,3-glucan-binding protein-like [Dreissena polymorpha]KAH3882684.1 hypothetical protein DPMN_006628 [Dreissena polymorpha]
MFGRLVTLLATALGIASSASVSFTQLQPQGFRFSLQDQPGISLVGFHYDVNNPLPGVAAGKYSLDIRTKTGNEWVYENPNLTLRPGDQIHYWYLVVDSTGGHTVTDQTWTVPSPMTTTRKATTARPTTVGHAHENSGTTHFVGSNLLNYLQNHTSGSAPAAGTETQSGASAAPNTGVVSNTNTNTQVSGSNSGGSGSCGCTGRSIRPPGSELTCSTFPCLIFDDEFDTLNLDVWEHEITAGGGGNWEFEYYTNNRSNSYVRDGKLFIKPTLTLDSLGAGPDGLTKGALDIWGGQPGDVCTGNNFWGCRRDGTPEHIINPIQSARLRSSRGFNFKYGKVEVRAKMPNGDWLWPAIWLLPLRNAYGKWPASGEIDIVEARGNQNYHDDKGNDQGINNAGSTLHFGSDFWHNKWPSAHGERLSTSGTYGDSFHIYTLIWDEDHISISIDGDEVLNVTPQTTMWAFGGNDQDGVENPWASGTKMAPFDQEFFLILNVAVGGTAFFPDTFVNPTGKPWSDKSDFAARDFWNARAQWYPTWHADQNNGEDAAMQVDYIRVWKLKP